MTQPKYPRTGKRGAPQTFARKLYEILEDDSTSSAFCWNEAGNAFFVQQQHRDLLEKILPKYFKQRKFSSFQRQLNLYGFKKVTKGPDKGAYAHSSFLRGQPQLLKYVRRCAGNSSQNGYEYDKYLPFIPQAHSNWYQNELFLNLDSFQNVGLQGWEERIGDMLAVNSKEIAMNELVPTQHISEKVRPLVFPQMIQNPLDLVPERNIIKEGIDMDSWNCSETSGLDERDNVAKMQEDTWMVNPIVPDEQLIHSKLSLSTDTLIFLREVLFQPDQEDGKDMSWQFKEYGGNLDQNIFFADGVQ
mmetsp:Transcript_25533/g.33374  ORF Transcript_25533/g.33374 Transcript_25533/m.33374 type:complete len:302 (-) Transcript_25533:110-1015(-)|eukprot:CAMPEP_0117762492 /NCGR_PEP_ID=MMETSP0947-20121206/17968_1 /TAXON_ID=44440 /ORGANISM="Chattonella subsalsa, Strain CCMP2191" /LENGTH=301 /DNA_ID=CAMNT_0005583805 /DNA_START=64 /DNA_END=969 /DNA_ORIENTATION=-